MAPISHATGGDKFAGPEKLSSRLGIVLVCHVLWCDVFCHTLHMGPCLCSMGAHTPPTSHFPKATAANMPAACL